jgi:hypothetical protein
MAEDDTARFTRGDVDAALNRAAALVTGAIGTYEGPLVDTVNLMVNAGSYLLDHPHADLREVVKACWTGSSYADVLAWITGDEPDDE